MFSFFTEPGFVENILNSTFAVFQKGKDSVAQLVEHYTFNVVVLGSNPSGITSWDKSENNRFVPFLLPYNLLIF